jgi:curved DNA-binding protein CbpA
MKDYYLILGIEPSDTTDTIRTAYKSMSQKYHPDKNQGDKYFEERFKDIYEAYEVLIDPEKRKTYDYQRLSHYRKDSKTSEGYRSTENRNVHEKEKGLEEREKRIDQWEKEFAEREAKLKRQLEALKTGSANRAKNMVLLVTIIAAFGISIFSILNADNIARGIYADRIDIKETELENETAEKEQLKLVNDSLLSDLKFLAGYAQSQDEKISELNKTIAEKKSRKISSAPPTGEEGISLSNRVILSNTTNVELLNLRWEDYDMMGEEKMLQRVSVLNKTDRAITSVTVSFEVKNSKGQPINSGEFIINPPSGVNGSRKEFVDRTEPKKAKEFYVNGLEVPKKRSSDLLLLTIKEFEFEL